MLEKVRRVAFAALCMCVCVSMKVRAEEYLIDEGMAVAEEPGPGPGTGGEGGSGEGESSNVPWYKRIIEMIASIPEKLIEGIKALFVPSEKALEEHEWLFNEKFNFWSGIKEQFEKIVGMLQGNGIPPKIEMDLSRIGAGKVTVLNFEGIDLTLFKKLESAFLWLSYILLLFRNVTGIIKGETTEVKE